MKGDIGLGRLVIGKPERDAVHVAVIACEAGEDLRPGQPVVIQAGKAVRTVAPSSYAIGYAIGVVDPFLGAIVKEGETFWLMIKPGTITSLMHLWTHPAFPLDTLAKQREDDIVGRAESEEWLRHFAREYGADYHDLLKMVEDREVCFSRDFYESELPEDFWFHIERATGKRYGADHRNETTFSCSC